MSDIKYVGQLSSSQNSRVIDPSGISYAVTNGHKDGEPKIIERNTPMKGNYTEPRICTMVGRDPENPSSRVRSDRYEQMIEMGDDVSNTLTSVQKDNLVAEPQILTPKRTDFGKQVRKQYEAGELDMSRHDMTELEPRKDGISNTLTSVQKDNLVAEPLQIKQATKQGYIEIPPGSVFDASYPDSQTRRGRVQDGGQTSPTLMASGEAPCYYEGVSVHPNSHALEFKGETSIKKDASPALRATDYKAPHCVWEKVAGELKDIASRARGENIEVTISDKGSLRPHKMDKAKSGCSEFQVEEENDTSSTLISARPNMTYGASTHYRIRKLTPRECFRLMGVTEENIDKIQQSGVSQSQQYKMAGNSIVVDCLFHLFRKMFTETENESNQMLLF